MTNKEKLIEEIEKLQKRAFREKQPKRKFEIHQQVLKLKEELELCI